MEKKNTSYIFKSIFLVSEKKVRKSPLNSAYFYNAKFHIQRCLRKDDKNCSALFLFDRQLFTGLCGREERLKGGGKQVGNKESIGDGLHI
jgi:hypothetical protein